jgi:hypothetical protein
MFNLNDDMLDGEHFILREVPDEPEEKMPDDRLSRLEADFSELKHLFYEKVPHLEAELESLAAKVDAPKPEEKPRRMKGNPGESKYTYHGVEHDENCRCRLGSIPCIPVEPEEQPCIMQANPESPDPYHREVHAAVWTCVGDPVCTPVEPEPAKEGEPSYPWDSAPPGTVAAGFSSNERAYFYYLNSRDGEFKLEAIYIQSGASLNGCPWEQSLRVNPKFKGGK